MCFDWPLWTILETEFPQTEPKNANEKSSYTGDASLDGYDIVFEEGKVVSKKIVSE